MNSLDLQKLISEANLAAQEATLICQANGGNMEKLPLVTLERIREIVRTSANRWWAVEQKLSSIIAKNV